MRLSFLLLFLLPCITANAQVGGWPNPQANASLEQLPPWMYELVNGEMPGTKWKPTGQPLHTNAFLGEWSVEFRNGRRVECWSDAQRLVFREYRDTVLKRAILLDLHANVRMNAEWYKGRAVAKIEDIRIPQAGYFRELWNDSVAATGRTQEILGSRCSELRGVDGNTDTTYYWHSDAYPELFADLGVWAQWLCREGDLEYLSALSDKNAGGSLRVDWNKRKYGPEAGSLWFTAIRPGKTTMPALDLRDAVVQESRFLYINSSQLGRLPDWMRERINPLAPHPLPLQYTPAAMDRHLPDNAFVGTFTAETPTRYIDEHQDTTLRIAKYSYWADARRAVLTLDDPDDEGIHVYMVDLDADVVVYGVNEGHSYVIPKLHIGSLENAGLVEFGRGLELDFTPTGKRTKLLGRKCELYTTSEPYYLTYFWFSDRKGPNPIFDMARWMQPRPSQKFKDILFFGAADMPIPFAVMGTHFTGFKPGKAAPPAMDLSNYSIRDERLREARDRERERTEPIRELIEYSPTYIGEGEMDMENVPVIQEEMVPEPPPVTPR